MKRKSEDAQERLYILYPFSLAFVGLNRDNSGYRFTFLIPNRNV